MNFPSLPVCVSYDQQGTFLDISNISVNSAHVTLLGLLISIAGIGW